MYGEEGFVGLWYCGLWVKGGGCEFMSAYKKFVAKGVYEEGDRLGKRKTKIQVLSSCIFGVTYADWVVPEGMVPMLGFLLVSS